MSLLKEVLIMATVSPRSAEEPVEMSYFDFSSITNYLYENASKIKEVAEPFIFALGTLFLTTLLVNAAITHTYLAIGIMSITFLASKIFNSNEVEQEVNESEEILDECQENPSEQSLIQSVTKFLNITSPT